MHQKKYGEKPLSAFHAHAYDATQMILAAIEKVAKKDKDGNTYIGRKALRAARCVVRDQGLRWIDRNAQLRPVRRLR